jgi:hypothetical protein
MRVHETRREPGRLGELITEIAMGARSSKGRGERWQAARSAMQRETRATAKVAS